MELVGAIRQLKDRALHDLTVAHNYYGDTREAWRLVQHFVDREGRTFTFTNTVTGGVTSEAQLVDKSRDYRAKQLPETTFQQFSSNFESFFAALFRLWLTAHPGILDAKKVTLKEVRDAPDLGTVIARAVEVRVGTVIRKGVSAWFEYLQKPPLKIAHGVSFDDIQSLAEARASRDILVHSSGLVLQRYGV